MNECRKCDRFNRCVEVERCDEDGNRIESEICPKEYYSMPIALRKEIETSRPTFKNMKRSETV